MTLTLEGLYAGLGDDITQFTPDEIAALSGPQGPDALGSDGSVSQFFQGIVNQSSAGTSAGGYSLPTGEQAAAGVQPAASSSGLIIGGILVAALFAVVVASR